MILAEAILYALFQYGEYLSIDVYMSSFSLRAYTIGLVAFMLIKVLASGYFSRQDTRTPVRIGIIAMVVNMGLNIVFVVPCHFLWQIGHAGLALATSISAFLNTGLLYRGLRNDKVYVPGAGWKRFYLQVLGANTTMVAVLLFGLTLVGDLANMDVVERVSRVILLCLAGLLSYLVVLLLLGMRMRHLRVAG